MKKTNCFTYTKLAMAILAAGGSATTSAQTLEEIVVTAQQRAQSLHDVPVSVSAISAQKMSNAGVVNLESLSAYVPNFSLNQTAVSTTVTIRGVSSGVNPGFEQSVGMYNDGVFYGRDRLARAPLFDLERVEVLRGTQSILFGKNSIAGAVSMISAKPTDEFEGSFTALYEPDADEQDLRLVLSGPLTDNLRGRIAIMDRQQKGYFKNATLNRDEQIEDESFIRGTLAWNVTDNVTTSLKVSQANFDSEGSNIDIYNSIDNGNPGSVDPLTKLNDIQASLGRPLTDGELNRVRDNDGDTSKNKLNNATLNVEWALEGLTISSTTAIVDLDAETACDCDLTSAVIFEASFHEEYEQFSQEFRFTSELGNTFDYIGGLFYQSSELDFSDSITLQPNGIIPLALPVPPPIAALIPGASTKRNFKNDSDLWAAFLQVTWNVNDDLRLTVGGRYTDETKEASREQGHFTAAGVAVPVPTAPWALDVTNLGTYENLFGLFSIEPYEKIKGDLDDTSFSPVITGQWDMNDETMLYATWTKGYKSGGFDARSNGHPDENVNNAQNVPALLGGRDSTITGSFEFDREEAETIELGSKIILADGAAELNVALYRTEFTDLQTSQFDGTLGYNVTNAGEATIQGLEVDGRWAVTESLVLTASGAYLDFNFDDFPNSQCAFGQTPNSPDFPGLCDESGERKEYTPEYQFNIGANWEAAITDGLVLKLAADANYMDDYLTSTYLDEETRQEATTVVNARIALAEVDSVWEVALIGRNLTDETIISYSGNMPLASTLTSGTGNAYFAHVNRPRNVAVQFNYNF
jgi:outer membrane receptor protein involved in Fe transport